MSLFQWEHQLFCYDWLFYKCFLVSFSRNVITRSGYWLLITQLNCLYCTTHFLALTWPESFDIRVGFFLLCEFVVFCFFFCLLLFSKEKINCSYWPTLLQPADTLFVISVNIKSYESLFIIVYIYWTFVQELAVQNWNPHFVVPLPLIQLYLSSPTAECIWSTCEFWNKC